MHAACSNQNQVAPEFLASSLKVEETAFPDRFQKQALDAVVSAIILNFQLQLAKKPAAQNREGAAASPLIIY